jgi:hypothetical protein
MFTIIVTHKIDAVLLSSTFTSREKLGVGANKECLVPQVIEPSPLMRRIGGQVELKDFK